MGNRPEIEIHWSIRADRRRRGYAAEIAEAAVRACFEHLAPDSVVAYTLVENDASRAVMRAAGFFYERDVPHAGLPHVVFRRRRPRPVHAP